MILFYGNVWFITWEIWVRDGVDGICLWLLLLKRIPLVYFRLLFIFEIWGLCLGFLYACPCRADLGWVPVMAFLGFGWDLDG